MAWIKFHMIMTAFGKPASLVDSLVIYLDGILVIERYMRGVFPLHWHSCQRQELCTDSAAIKSDRRDYVDDRELAWE